MHNYVKLHEALVEYFEDLEVDFITPHEWINEVMDDETREAVSEADPINVKRIAMEQAVAAFEAQASLYSES